VTGAQPPTGGVSALSALNAAEKAAVLDELTSRDTRLRGRAERIALRHLAETDGSEIAEAVAASILTLESDELASRSGRMPCGYVEPTQAAWDLLDETIRPWIDDIGRLARLGLDAAARQTAIGILDGVYRCNQKTRQDGLLLGWAPDFPSEAADSVIAAVEAAGLDVPAHEFARVAPDWTSG
jgi:hypothetical protein